eukprot:TRINITY_DN9633_c0_g1_i1.p1 TRINITY_DN9633_c0_g1~~TRINITY_DN9633_c0_g1_i1.p1  ORF type:complete len:267 (+),score=11.19 TRINITY_DN9633_c0_g1_i1:280-1080(+)
MERSRTKGATSAMQKKKSKKHSPSKGSPEVYSDDEKDVAGAFHPFQPTSSFPERCQVPVNSGQPLLAESSWSLDEILILTLALYKANGDLRYVLHLFPGKDIYRHVLSALTNTVHNIKFKSFFEPRSISQIQILELLVHVGILLDAIEGCSPIPEVDRIVQCFQVRDKDCFEFLERICPQVKFSQETFAEFLESAMERVENKMYELSGNTGNLKDLMNLKNNAGGHPFMLANPASMQYPPVPYMSPFAGCGFFSFWSPFPFPPQHL